MPLTVEAPRLPHSGQQRSSHGVQLCHACGWPFPNHHPSAKQRRAHKKHCGKVEGYPLMGGANEELSDESSRGVSVSSVVMEGSEKSGEEEEYGCLDDIKAPEENAEGDTTKFIDTAFLDNRVVVPVSSTLMENVEDDLHLSDAHGINSKKIEIILTDSKEYSAIAPDFYKQYDQKSDTNNVLNVEPCSISMDCPDKLDESGKAEEVLEMLAISTSSAVTDSLNFKLDLSMPHSTETSEFPGHMLGMEENSEHHNKERDQPDIQVLVNENFEYHAEAEILEIKSVAPAIQDGYPVGSADSDAKNENFECHAETEILKIKGVVPAIQNGYLFGSADSDTKNETNDGKGEDCQAMDVQSSSRSCSSVEFEDAVGSSSDSLQNSSGKIMGNDNEDEVKSVHRMPDYQPDIIPYPMVTNIADSMGSSLYFAADSSVETVENDAIQEKEQVENKSGKQESGTAISDCPCHASLDEVEANGFVPVTIGMLKCADEEENVARTNDAGKEHTLPSTFDCNLKIEEGVGLEDSDSSNVNHVREQFQEFEMDHVLVGSKTSEKMECCNKVPEVDNVLVKTETAGLHSPLEVRTGKYYEERNSSGRFDSNAISNGKFCKETTETDCQKMQVNSGKTFKEGGLAEIKAELSDNGITDLNGLAVLANQYDGTAVSDVLQQLGLEEVHPEKETHQDSSHDTGSGIPTTRDTDDFSVSYALERNNVLGDGLHMVNEDSEEALLERDAIEPVMVPELSDLGSSKSIEDLELISSSIPNVSDAVPQVENNLNDALNNFIDKHCMKDEACETRSDIGIKSEDVYALEEKHDALLLTEVCELNGNLDQTEFMITNVNIQKGVESKNASSALAIDENDTHLAFILSAPIDYEPSVPKEESWIEKTEANTSNNTSIPASTSVVGTSLEPKSLRIDVLAHFQGIAPESNNPNHSSSSIPYKGMDCRSEDGDDAIPHTINNTSVPVSTADWNGEVVGASLVPESLRIDALASVQRIVPESDTSNRSSASVPSKGLDHHLEDGNSAIPQTQPVVAAFSNLDALVDSTSGTNKELGSTSEVCIPSITVQQLNGTPDTTPTILAGSSFNAVTTLKASPSSSSISPGTESNSPEIWPVQNLKRSGSQSTKNTGEISEASTSQSARKLRTPLKSLLHEASIESKLGIFQPNDQPSTKDPSTPKIASSLNSEQPIQPVIKRVVQKEWNSPARLPQNVKNSKVKTKGKQQWVPFMCCPSVN